MKSGRNQHMKMQIDQLRKKGDLIRLMKEKEDGNNTIMKLKLKLEALRS